MGLEEAASGKRFRASTLERGDHIVNVRAKLHPKTFEKICRTIDEAIQDVVEAKVDKLVWLNTGSLVGDRAHLPHESHRHLWESIYNLFPNALDPVALKARRITVGALIKWRVACREEEWLVHYRETNSTDVVTGDIIKASEYWIKPAGLITSAPARRSIPLGVTIEDLKKKFKDR